MALYARTLIVVNNRAEADAINAEINRDDIWHDVYAIPYGAPTIGMRYQYLDMRYSGVRNSKYEMHELTNGLRKDLSRGFIR